MSNNNNEDFVDNREAELRLLLAFAKHFVKTEDLHYGVWPEGLEVSMENIPAAQENHSKLIISSIPENTKTILDVGMGIGKLSQRLTQLGYQVEGVSPSPYLARYARGILGEDFKIYLSKIEDLETDKQYDLVLFSESFQYVDMPKALEKVWSALKPGGHLLICDFFQIPAEGTSPLKAGPKLVDFYRFAEAQGFVSVKDQDITKETAPNMDIASDVMVDFFKPIWDLFMSNLKTRRPLLNRILNWKFKGKIKRVNWRYFDGLADGEHFLKFKSYRLLCYRKPEA